MSNHIISHVPANIFKEGTTSTEFSINFRTAHKRVLGTIEAIISRLPSQRSSALFRKTRGGKPGTTRYEMSFLGSNMVFQALEADNAATQRYTVLISAEK